MKTRIFMVDDDLDLWQQVNTFLKKKGFTVEMVHSIGDARDEWLEFGPDLILLDLRLPDGEGTEFLETVKSHSPEVMVVMLSGHANIHHAVEAKKQGAEDFLPKPTDPEHLLLVVNKLIARRRLQNHAKVMELEIADKQIQIISESKKMRDLLGTAKRAADSESTILITAETGTGKHLMAHFIHEHSPRKEYPFVYVNCATLSETLLESDLFGHEKGAFTGAQKQKEGRVEIANGGTLFLDEIGEITINLQAKILHFIEYGEFQRVGGTATKRADVRIICATNRDLAHEVQEGNFREDLYYRINVIQLNIPPLRERRDDIPALIDYFSEKLSRDKGRKSMRISDSTLEKLKNFSWPGNIRELQNSMERAVVLSGSNVLGDSDFPFLGVPVASAIDNLFDPRPLQEAINIFKKRYINELLGQTNGNQTEAAKTLDIQRTYLNRLIKELGIK